MNPRQKVALLLSTLEPAVAESVLFNLGPQHGDPLRSEIQALKKTPPAPDVLQGIVAEFDELLQELSADAARAKPPEPPPPPPPKTPEPPPAPPPLENFDGHPDPMAAIKLLDPDRLALALKGENPRTIALVLGGLESTRAAEVLKRMAPEARREVVPFLGKPLPVSGEVLQRIARALLQKCQAAKEASGDGQSPAKKMADVLRCLDKPERLELLAALDERDPELAAKVKEMLYQFEDLLAIEDRSMQKLLSEVDSRNLATALKGASEEIKQKVMNNLSKRARESLGEEMEFLGSVPPPQAAAAQKVIVEVIQRLDQAGELVMQQ